MVDVGEQAPGFTLEDGQGRTVRLEDHRGKRVVLYFYPKDMTSGCTQQACDLRDRHAAITALGAVVLGVSPDPAARHAKFAAKEGLPFTLLADVEHRAAEAYGVWQEKSLYGRKYLGVVRSTFILDERGVVTHAWRNVKVPGHAEAVLAALGGAPAPATKARAQKAPAKKAPAKKSPAKKAPAKKAPATKARAK